MTTRANRKGTFAVMPFSHGRTPTFDDFERLQDGKPKRVALGDCEECETSTASGEPHHSACSKRHRVLTSADLPGKQ
jgi:hypothetical protein